MTSRGQIDQYAEILSCRGIKSHVENGTNHDRLCYKVDDKSYFVTLPRHKEGDTRGHKNNIADILRRVSHIPIKSKTKGNGKGHVTTSGPPPQEIDIKFGVRGNGYLSASFKQRDLDRRFKILPRATVKLTTSKLVVISFHQEPNIGNLPAVNKGTVSYIFPRKSVPFEYTTKQVDGRSTPGSKASFVGNNELVTKTELPTILLVRPSQQLELTPKPEPKVQLEFKKTPEFVFSDDLGTDGKVLKELFNDWLERVEKSGSVAEIEFENNQIKLFVTVNL